MSLLLDWDFHLNDNLNRKQNQHSKGGTNSEKEKCVEATFYPQMRNAREGYFTPLTLPIAIRLPHHIKNKKPSQKAVDTRLFGLLDNTTCFDIIFFTNKNQKNGKITVFVFLLTSKKKIFSILGSFS